MDFTKLTRLYLPLLIPGILDAKRMSYDRFVEKIEDLEFVTRSVTQDAKEISIHLQIIDEELLQHLLSGEANKFWLASMFTLNRAHQMQNGNVAWQAVEHYYAAYYAVHYLLRISGVSLTNLDSKAISVIESNNFGVPISGNIPNGLYTIRYDKNNSTLQLKKNIKNKGGGSHKDAWRLWEELILRLLKEAETDTVEYANTAVQLSEHRSFVVRSTDQYNPPEMRGEINYQFKGGVWIFEKNASKSINELQSFIPQPAVAPVKAPLNVKNLMSNNKIIIELAKKMFLHGANNYPRSICRHLAHKYSTHLDV